MHTSIGFYESKVLFTGLDRGDYSWYKVYKLRIAESGENMKVERLDHLVITTQNLQACLHFYRDILGMEVVEQGGRYALCFGEQKFNIHQKKAEFLPAAAHPTYGSLDLCLVVAEKLAAIKKEVEAKGYPIELGPVVRHGALGEMKSLYVRDPDGNLVELCHYGK